MAKRLKLEEKFLEELRRIPNISFACEKVGISRNSIYRWRAMDREFNHKVEQALPMGRDSINDLAESCVIQNIKAGKLPAAKYWLENNLDRYYRPKKPLRIDPEYKGIASFTIIQKSKEDMTDSKPTPNGLSTET